MSIPPLRRTIAPQIKTPASKTFKIVSGPSRSTWKVGIYGPEGIGKSTLASLCPGVTFADIELSMRDINVRRIEEGIIANWQDLLDWTGGLSNCWAGIDSMTRAEDWAVLHVIAGKVGNDGTKAKDSLEDFKYKAGLRFVNDEFKKLLAAIDASTHRGVSWVMTAHNRVRQFKDPENNDYIRHEPNLVDIDDPKMGSVSNMRSWIQFLDVCAFMDLDINVEKRKAKTGGTRTIYLDTSASHISKGRGIDCSRIDFDLDKNPTELWQRIGVVK
jgi:energy-coupling factor transporter ATP-binding protein EcfA2